MSECTDGEHSIDRLHDEDNGTHSRLPLQGELMAITARMWSGDGLLHAIIVPTNDHNLSGGCSARSQKGCSLLSCDVLGEPAQTSWVHYPYYDQALVASLDRRSMRFLNP